jgi:hypothetical protein
MWCWTASSCRRSLGPALILQTLKSSRRRDEAGVGGDGRDGVPGAVGVAQAVVNQFQALASANWL